MSSQTNQRKGCGILIAIVVIVAVLSASIQRNVLQSNYTKGHQAYQQMDCASAIIHFDNIINHLSFFTRGETYTTLAYQERSECVSFQEGIHMHQSGAFAEAIMAYYNVIIKNKQSGNKSSPLVEVARNRFESLFRESEPSALANQEVCDYVPAFLENDLILQRDTILPALYFACGEFYEESGAHTSAIDMYEQFQRGYPNHPLSSEVEVALAHSIVANAKAGGTGELGAPELSGNTSDGSTVVIIQNDSHTHLRIVFTGPEDRIEKLEACSTCSAYYRDMYFSGASCPDTVPTGRYIVKPGQYDVVVESSGIGTKPWRGYWTLKTGSEYSSCFYIVKTLNLP